MSRTSFPRIPDTSPKEKKRANILAHTPDHTSSAHPGVCLGSWCGWCFQRGKDRTQSNEHYEHACMPMLLPLTCTATLCTGVDAPTADSKECRRSTTMVFRLARLWSRYWPMPRGWDQLGWQRSQPLHRHPSRSKQTGRGCPALTVLGAVQMCRGCSHASERACHSSRCTRS